MAEYSLYKPRTNSNISNTNDDLILSPFINKKKKEEGNKIVNGLAKKGNTYVSSRKRPTKKKRKSTKRN